MPTGIFYDATQDLVATITGLGFVPVTDPRNARPRTVFIEPPSFDAFTYNVGDLTFRISVLAAPPGNQDASDYLLTTVDALMNSALPITSGAPGTIDVSGQTIPCYDLTVRIAARRN